MILKIALLFVLLFGFEAWASPVIEIRAYTKIKKQKVIRLSDIAKLEGFAKAMQKKLKAIVLGNAPEVGEKRIFTNRAIAEILRKNLNSEDKPQFKIPRKIVIENKGFELSKQNIEKDLKKLWGKKCRACRFVVTSMSLPLFHYEMKTAKWEVFYDGPLPKVTVSARIKVDEKSALINTYWVTGTVEVHKKVPVLKRAFYIGERIREGDFSYQWRNVAFYTDGIPEKHELIGKRVRLSLRADSILLFNSIEREKALKRGDTVRVTSGKEGWQVSILGKALQDGQVGDRIHIKNPKTKKVISAIVKSKGEAVIE